MVPSRGKELIKTDLNVAVPPGTYGRVAPRSGLAVKNFIDVGAGVVDADYRYPNKLPLTLNFSLKYFGLFRNSDSFIHFIFISLDCYYFIFQIFS